MHNAPNDQGVSVQPDLSPHSVTPIEVNPGIGPSTASTSPTSEPNEPKRIWTSWLLFVVTGFAYLIVSVVSCLQGRYGSWEPKWFFRNRRRETCRRDGSTSLYAHLTLVRPGQLLLLAAALGAATFFGRAFETIGLGTRSVVTTCGFTDRIRQPIY